MSENQMIQAEDPKTALQDMRGTWQDASSFDIAMRGAMALTQSDLVPAMYRTSPGGPSKLANCMIALDMANRMGLPPLMVMQNMYVVQGKPSWSGQACMTMIRNCGEFDEVRPEYTGERGKDTWGCAVKAKRRTTGETVTGPEVTIDMAKKEGWYSKGGSKWQTMPELMLAYRAAAFFARIHCPEALMGMQLREEVEDAGGKREVVDPLG